MTTLNLSEAKRDAQHILSLASRLKRALSTPLITLATCSIAEVITGEKRA